jgi:AcrR family transcriptional regulator
MQARRRSRSRAALLESTARHLSRYGYGNLSLESVARDAGYTRGALYHQFADKDDLVLAVLAWVDETWREAASELIEPGLGPADELLALARAHAIYCRRDVARFAMALRLEFAGQDHPVGHEIERVSESGVRRATRLVRAGRADGSIPEGPPAVTTARALMSALEGTVIGAAGTAPHDETLAERAVAGVLGLSGRSRRPRASDR